MRGLHNAQRCLKTRALIVSDSELKKTEFVIDVRAFAHSLALDNAIWRTFLLDAYRDYRGVIIDQLGRETFIDTSVFEDEADDDDWRPVVPESAVRAFFRTYTTPMRPGALPRFTPLSRERFRAMATILRARFPSDAVLWGVRAANDNEPMKDAS